MPASATVPDRRTAGSPLAVAVVFAAAGFVMAQTLARVPALRDSVGASQAELGLALVGGGLGSLLAMPHTARLVSRFGNLRVTAVSLVLASLGWGSVAFAPNVWVLAGLLVLAGAPVGVWDVSMNIQGFRVEQLRSRTLMPYLHAAFSAGTVAGAGLGALAAWQGIGLGQVPVGAVLALLAGLAAVRAFVPVEDTTAGDGAQDPAEESSTGRGISVLEILIGVVCLGAALAEGAANDWLALLLVDVRGAPEAFGALAFMAFNVTMLLGRLAGGAVTRWWGRDVVARVGGVLAATGILLVTLVPSLPVALVGGLLWGLGVSTIFPAAISAAGEVPGRGTRAIGVVSTIAYGAFLFGAPTIGLLAERFGLDRALWLVVCFLALMVLLAGALRARPPWRAAPPAPARSRPDPQP
ncbi:MFS transporter [Ornithinicoccus hortensis]|uniref:Putative MFS family arabinose efflux permease n=1 Tax=Ornithinicoccus hortensis TaxID=82346 RepID=A0A542YPD4_9MICO|nr:MFS transporter [Ornithinicoccus hortensis]TQL49907.1 putative MFS family arabinose efflux permease [Ornithinicoccus hortensis]